MGTTGKRTGKPGRPQATRIERRRAAIDRRRAHARAGVVAQIQARRRRRAMIRWGLAVAGVVVAAIVGVVVWRRDGDGDGPSADLYAAAVESDGEPLGITAPPQTYALTYRIETFAGDGDETTITTGTTIVRRPFDSRIANAEGEPPGAAQQWALIGQLGLAASVTGTSSTEARAVAPMTAIGDWRLDASLDDLVGDGVFVQRERRTLLGRECQVYRTGLPLENLSVAPPTEADYVDVCIDAAGLMLEEVYIAAGEVLQHRAATSVDDSVEPADADFAIDVEPLAPEAGGADLATIDPVAAPVPGYWALPAPPDGYEHVGRYALREEDEPEPDGDPASGSSTTVPTPISVESYADVYVDGVDVIIVRQGPVRAEPNGDITTAPQTESAVLGSIQVSSGVTGSTLLAHPTGPEEWFVSITATTSRAELTALAERLTATS